MREYPKGFKPGDEVRKEMGIRMNGIVSNPFHWKDSTDGTYKEPGKEDVPVCWNDGTCGYCHKSYLVKVSTLR